MHGMSMPMVNMSRGKGRQGRASAGMREERLWMQSEGQVRRQSLFQIVADVCLSAVYHVFDKMAARVQIPQF